LDEPPLEDIDSYILQAGTLSPASRQRRLQLRRSDHKSDHRKNQARAGIDICYPEPAITIGRAAKSPDGWT
jgi:hypothetical protein